MKFYLQQIGVLVSGKTATDVQQRELEAHLLFGKLEQRLGRVDGLCVHWRIHAAGANVETDADHLEAKGTLAHCRIVFVGCTYVQLQLHGQHQQAGRIIDRIATEFVSQRALRYSGIATDTQHQSDGDKFETNI